MRLDAILHGFVEMAPFAMFICGVILYSMNMTLDAIGMWVAALLIVELSRCTKAS